MKRIAKLLLRALESVFAERVAARGIVRLCGWRVVSMIAQSENQQEENEEWN